MTARQIAENVQPDFAGRTASGLHGVLLTYRDVQHDRHLWSFGFGMNVIEAREQAVAKLEEQIVAGMMWTPGSVFQ